MARTRETHYEHAHEDPQVTQHDAAAAAEGHTSEHPTGSIPPNAHTTEPTEPARHHYTFGVLAEKPVTTPARLSGPKQDKRLTATVLPLTLTLPVPTEAGSTDDLTMTVYAVMTRPGHQTPDGLPHASTGESVRELARRGVIQVDVEMPSGMRWGIRLGAIATQDCLATTLEAINANDALLTDTYRRLRAGVPPKATGRTAAPRATLSL